MTDFSDPAGANLRLSTTEREEAVSLLEAHARDGRLSESELSSRTAAARAAVTRGDLAPLFADLPPAPVQTPDAGSRTPAFPDEPAGAQPFRWRQVVQYLSPLVSLILFFVTGWIWGFQYSWLWFILVPIAWALSSGFGGDGYGRRRDR